MFHLHITKDKQTEYEEVEESLDAITERKIRKLITQIKTRKVVDPTIDISIVEELEKFKSGKLQGSIPGLYFIIERNDDSLYLEKVFSNDHYVTLRYYSLERNDKFEEIKEHMIKRKDYWVERNFEAD